MSAATERHSHPKRCLVRAVLESMRNEPRLEGVKINCREHSVSVATLGQSVPPDLEARLKKRITQTQSDRPGDGCMLLAGEESCHGCPIELEEQERGRIIIEHDGDAMKLTRPSCPTAPRFWRWSQLALPKFVPLEVELPDEGDHEHEWKEQLVAAGLCGALGLAGGLAAAHPWAIFLNLGAYVAGSWFTAQEVRERLEKGMLDVHFLMLAVAFGSAAIGAWSEGATLLFLFSLSGALEHYAMGRTSREIRSLFRTAPKSALVLDERGQETTLPIETLRPGHRLLIKPGDQFPVDAEITKGKTAADESNLTGEAAPVDKAIGDTVLAGTMNQWGVVEAVVLRPAGQSALQKIIQLIQEAQHLKAPSQRFTDKFGSQYTYGILGLTTAMFFVWWLGFGQSPFVTTAKEHSAFYHAMTLLVVTSPCALVLSIPSAILAAIAWAAKRGVLFRGGAAVEKLAEIDVVAMDKTGTLTTGELDVERVESFPPGREKEVAQLAYSLERMSTHPLARAITRYGKQQQVAALELDHFESITGLGLHARFGGDEVRLGRREWLAEFAPPAALRDVPMPEAGISEVCIVADGLAGRILLRDEIRPESGALVNQLRQLGLRSVVLTGDRQAAANRLKTELQLDDVRAELKPDQKVAAIAEFNQQGHRAAMIGDGVNDAPSLAAAHVGVAMGARGSDAAMEQAEVILMHDRLENFITAYQLSRRARRIIRQNLVISLGTVIVLLVLAICGAIPLTIGVIGHEGSTVVVVMNSLRLLLAGSGQVPGRG